MSADTRKNGQRPHDVAPGRGAIPRPASPAGPMVYPTSCRFCAVSTGAVNERVWRIPRWPLFAFRSSRVSSTIVVAWHQHRASFHELEVDECRELLTGALHVAIEMGLDDYRLVANVGREGGQRVMHAHVLLVEPE